MPRLLRSDLPDGFFHVTARGVDGVPIFRDDCDRVAFLRLLGDCVHCYAWTCRAFCLMTTHYHLVVDAPRRRLSEGMHRLNGAYAQAFNRRHRRAGHLFGDRFSAYAIESEKHVAAACRYVLLNPVRAGLCATASEWPWSGSSYASAA